MGEGSARRDVWPRVWKALVAFFKWFWKFFWFLWAISE